MIYRSFRGIPVPKTSSVRLHFYTSSVLYRQIVRNNVFIFGYVPDIPYKELKISDLQARGTLCRFSFIFLIVNSVLSAFMYVPNFIYVGALGQECKRQRTELSLGTFFRRTFGRVSKAVKCQD